MADELTIKVSAKLDEGSVSGIQSQLDGLSKNNKNKIQIQVDDRVVTDSIKSIQNSLNQLTSKPYRIELQIDQSIINNINSITNSLNQAVNNVQRSVGQQLSNIRTSPVSGNYTGISKVIQKGKVNELTGFEATSEIEKRNLALGETLTIYKELKKEQDEEIGRMEEVSRQYETNYELQAKAQEKAALDLQKQQEKIQGYITQQRNAQNNLLSSTLNQKDALDKDSPYGQKALESIFKYQKAIDDLEKGSTQYNADTRRELATLYNTAKNTIKEQKALQQLDIQRQQSEQKASDYNSKKMSDANIAMENLKSKAFNQNNPLTGDFKKNAEDAIAEWKTKIDEIQGYSKKMTQEQENALKEAQAKAQRTVLEQQKAQWQGDKLAAKDVGQKVANAEWGLDIRVEELKQAGQYSDEAKAKIQELRNSLAQVGDQKGFNEWSKQLQQFNQEIELANQKTKTTVSQDNFNLDVAAVTKQFDELKQKYKEITDSNAQLGNAEVSDRIQRIGESLNNISPQNISTVRKELRALNGEINAIQSSPSMMGQNLADSIGAGQIEQIQNLTNILSNLPSDISGAGVENLKQELSTLASEYNNLMTQLQSGNLTSDQFTDLSNKVKELDDRLKQASNAAKMFQDGFKNEQALEKYNLNVENLNNRFERLKQKYDEFVQSNPGKASADLEQRFAAVKQALENGDPTNLSTVTAMMRNLATATTNVVTPAQSLSQILTQNLGGVGQYLARFTSAFYIINTSIRTIKSMVNEVKALDTSLVELQKVTSLSGDSLEQFTDNAYKTGKEVGRTGKDVIDAVTTFSRAGYNLEESNTLAQAALTMTNVGVDIPNTEAAASDMISILKAFDKQADESMQVIDELYNVANKEPLDFGNITQMLVTAGGTLAQTNTSLEETMGLLTGGFATLRDTSVANG